MRSRKGCTASKNKKVKTEKMGLAGLKLQINNIFLFSSFFQIKKKKKTWNSTSFFSVADLFCSGSHYRKNFTQDLKLWVNFFPAFWMINLVGWYSHSHERQLCQLFSKFFKKWTFFLIFTVSLAYEDLFNKKL